MTLNPYTSREQHGQNEGDPLLVANEQDDILGFLATGDVISDTVTTPTGLESRGDAYLIPAGGSGTFAAPFAEGDIALRLAGGWHRIVPRTGTRIRIASRGRAIAERIGADWAFTDAFIDPSLGERFTGRFNAAGDKIYRKVIDAGLLPGSGAIRAVAHGIASISLDKPLLVLAWPSTTGSFVPGYGGSFSAGVSVVTVDATNVNLQHTSGAANISALVAVEYSRA